MTLEEIYYIGQTIAVFLIFGSLVAIYQQRHREKLLDQFDRNQAATERLSSWYDRMRDNPEYARIIRVSAHHWEVMPDNPKFVAHLFWTSVFQSAGRSYADARAGLGKAMFHEELFLSLVGALMMPGTRAWWTQNKRWMSPDFQAEIDRRLEQPDPRQVPWHEITPLWKAGRRDLDILIADEAARLDEGRANPDVSFDPKDQA